ncbi:hypothetical protein [Chromobacterium subtsugae]|uniref:hypothetical protein n=1 Tax=Chromobacterium subtsugae TaxID=251747 RepID=UPI0012D3A8F7|nr:hypothetical protein [Chromobacterium subtsugae]
MEEDDNHMDSYNQYPKGDLPKGYACGSITLMKHTIRRERLQQLINERFNGNKGKFADFMGKARPQIYRLFSEGEHRRDIGEDMAREIEEKVGLAKFQLDRPLEGDAAGDGADADINLQALPAELQELVKDLYRAYLAQSLSPKLIETMRTLTQSFGHAPSDKAAPVHAGNLSIASRLAKQLDNPSGVNPASPTPKDDKNGDLDAN